MVDLTGSDAFLVGICLVDVEVEIELDAVAGVDLIVAIRGGEEAAGGVIDLLGLTGAALVDVGVLEFIECRAVVVGTADCLGLDGIMVLPVGWMINTLLDGTDG
jgi:hypothetical protein